MFTVDCNVTSADEKIGSVMDALSGGQPLMESIAGALRAETERNFAADGRPHWHEWAASTKAARMKGNNGSSVLQMLQEHGNLAGDIFTDDGNDWAGIGVAGAAIDYAPIHQFGGDIDIPAHSRKVRLREDAKGNLLRQGDKGNKKNLAVFAKEKGDKAHKHYRDVNAEVPAHSVHIPARPYLPFSGTSSAPVFQPEAEKSVLEAISAAALNCLR